MAAYSTSSHCWCFNSLSCLTQKILNSWWCAVYTELGEHAWMSSVIIKLILLQKYWVWGRGCPPPATLFCDKKLCSSNTVLHQLASNWLSKLIITKVVMIHHKSRWSHVQLQLLNLSVIVLVRLVLEQLYPLLEVCKPLLWLLIHLLEPLWPAIQWRDITKGCSDKA